MSDVLGTALAELVRSVVREELERAGLARSAAPSGAVEWLDQRQAAELLGVDARTVRRLTKSYELACSYVGSRPRYARAELLAYLERQKGARANGG